MLNFINIYFLELGYELLSWLKYIQTDRRETKWSYNKFYYKLILEIFLQQLRIIVRWCIQSQNPAKSRVNELFHHLEVDEPEIQRTKLLRINILIIYRLNVLFLPIEIILVYSCRLKLAKLSLIPFQFEKFYERYSKPPFGK